nr:hypothetical protein [Bacteroidota bacterium]
MKLFKFCFLFCALALLTSCAIQPLQYKGYEGLKVTKLKLNPELKMDLVFYNPNGAGCIVKDLNLKIAMYTDTMAAVKLGQIVKLKAYDDLKLPVNCAISTGPLLKNSLKGLFTGDDISVTYTGYVTIQKFIFKKTFPINFTEKMNRKQLLPF